MAGSTSGGPTAAAPSLADNACLLSAAAATREPKLTAALLKVQQLDGALAAADRRAVAAAAARRVGELGHRAKVEMEASNLAGGAANKDAACESGGLAVAMARERRLLQNAERLRRALQEDGAATSPALADVGVGGDGQAGLTIEQEALLEAQLIQPDELAEPAVNPYAAALAELEAVETQLAHLRAACNCSSGPSPLIVEAVCEAPRGARQQGGADFDVEAAREGYLR